MRGASSLKVSNVICVAVLSKCMVNAQNTLEMNEGLHKHLQILI